MILNHITVALVCVFELACIAALIAFVLLVLA
jgi:hypothetical protein